MKKISAITIALLCAVLFSAGCSDNDTQAQENKSEDNIKKQENQSGNNKTTWEEELQTAKNQGITFSKDNKTLLKCPSSLYGKVVIPSCVTNIDDNAFYDCSNLTRIRIPSSALPNPSTP